MSCALTIGINSIMVQHGLKIIVILISILKSCVLSNQTLYIEILITSLWLAC